MADVEEVDEEATIKPIPMQISIGSFIAAQEEPAEGIERERAFDFDLIVEELFTNMVKYSREGKDDIEVALVREADGLRLTLRDFNVERFDVTGTPDVDISVPISERRAGGLGLHLVRRMADRFEYDYRDRVSTITVWKRL